MRHRLFVCLVGFIAVGFAARLQATDLYTQVVVTSATVAADGTTLFVTGNNLGRTPVVTVGTQRIAGVIVDETGTVLTGIMPALPPGDYRLLVWTGSKWGALTLTVNPHASVGTRGEPGPAGPAGPMGLQGPEGQQGPAGLNGAVGPQGPAGPQGLVGAVGPQGPAGSQGLDGAVGPQGSAGPQGLDGVVGPQGPAGVPGMPGMPGAQGPQGPAGPAGPGGIGFEQVNASGAWAGIAAGPETASTALSFNANAPEAGIAYVMVFGSCSGPVGSHLRFSLGTTPHRFEANSLTTSIDTVATGPGSALGEGSFALVRTVLVDPGPRMFYVNTYMASGPEGELHRFNCNASGTVFYTSNPIW